jgi:hypothetical protein
MNKDIHMHNVIKGFWKLNLFKIFIFFGELHRPVAYSSPCLDDRVVA